MSDRIEPGCLAVILDLPSCPYSGAIVRVIETADHVKVDESVMVFASHCPKCAASWGAYWKQYGHETHWVVDVEDVPPPPWPPIVPESMLRRLPPPDIEQFTARKDTSVSA